MTKELKYLGFFSKTIWDYIGHSFHMASASLKKVDSVICRQNARIKSTPKAAAPDRFVPVGPLGWPLRRYFCSQGQPLPTSSVLCSCLGSQGKPLLRSESRPDRARVTDFQAALPFAEVSRRKIRAVTAVFVWLRAETKWRNATADLF